MCLPCGGGQAETVTSVPVDESAGGAAGGSAREVAGGGDGRRDGAPVAGGAGVGFEPKFDGFRALAFCGPYGVVLQSRQQRPLSDAFPDITAALAPLGEPPRFRIPDPIRSGPERRTIYARTAQEVHT